MINSKDLHRCTFTHITRAYYAYKSDIFRVHRCHWVWLFYLHFLYLK